MITAKDLCKRDGCKTHNEWIMRRCGILKSKGLLDTPFTGEIVGNNVYAEVDWGRWIAKCECGGVEYVCKDEKIFYCFSCGNYELNGKGRRVIFPDNQKMQRIEEVLDEREMIVGKGTEKLGRVLHAKPKIPNLSRTWNKEETLNDLKKQNKEANLLDKLGVKNGV